MINRKKYHIMKSFWLQDQSKYIEYLCGWGEKCDFSGTIRRYPDKYSGICKKCEKKANE